MVFSRHDKHAKRPGFTMMVESVGNEKGEAYAIPVTRPVDWRETHAEGQLAVDVLDDGNHLVIVAPMAGANIDNIEISIHNDLLTIRGVRERPARTTDHTPPYHEECFWGPFSRTIVLPIEVHGGQAKAEYRHGVLIIRLPKWNKHTKVPIVVVDE